MGTSGGSKEERDIFRFWQCKRKFVGWDAQIQVQEEACCIGCIDACNTRNFRRTVIFAEKEQWPGGIRAMSLVIVAPEAQVFGGFDIEYSSFFKGAQSGVKSRFSLNLARWKSTEYGQRHNGRRIVMSVVAWELGPGYVVKSNNITGGPIHVFSPPKMETFRRHARKLYERPTCVFLYSQCIRVSPS
ncbi:hypothetical protein L6452_15762 [Arctium lappa]|uniref:Uncharacterized protein n=1 Tax=Arctium lappa TaxID=4217 RepID=A0ACB9CPK1_ARCLA|nr:hypothetical protein L6452_15762 [Arctium lappa]